MNERKIMNTLEVAEMTGIASGTLANYRHRKVGPRYYKACRKCLYNRADVEAWLKNSIVETADSIKIANAE